MALTTITNGDNPDATVLMANFNFLAAGGGIKADTVNNLKVYAALNPTVPFLCIATGDDVFLLYCGNPARGSGGFVTLASFGEVS